MSDHAADPRIVHTAPPPRPEVHDPLRLCIFATVAAIAWLAGPLALVFFAVLGIRGYVVAIRGGLTQTRCLWHDPRVSVLYLGALAALGVGALAFGAGPWQVGSLG
jgi:hypothetical protein